MAQSFNDFAKINDHLIVGSHPRDAVDIRKLYYGNHVRAIENLQESGERLRGDIDAITAECALLGNRIWYQRVPIQDGKEQSVRDNLPEAVGILNRAIQEKAKEPGDTVYLHCCAGYGRSPSVAAAYLYWFGDNTTFQLDATCQGVEAKRPGSTTDIEAIRGATYDILGRNNGPDNLHALPPQAFRTVTAQERDIIQKYVTTKLPRVSNA